MVLGSGESTYKVKIASGRILGPLDLDRVRDLILKNQITGTETARRYPDGEWEDINAISEIGELLVQHAAGELKARSTAAEDDFDGDGRTRVLMAPTRPISKATETRTIPEAEDDQPSVSSDFSEPDGDEGKTRVGVSDSEDSDDLPGLAEEDEEKTRVGRVQSSSQSDEEPESKTVVRGMALSEGDAVGRSVANEATVAFDRGTVELDYTSTRVALPQAGVATEQPNRRAAIVSKLRPLIVLLAVGLAAHEYFFPEQGPVEPQYKPTMIRPKLPASPPEGTNAAKSQKLYYNGMIAYAQDTVNGYRIAAENLLDSASYDIRNAKAIAMLASSYLNLVDSSAKDENYFSIISKLVEMARAKAYDQAETVIADVEFFNITHQPEAAENRLVEATKSGKIPDFLSAFYLGYSAYGKGDYASAARYFSQIPDNKIPTPKMFYYRGLVSEKLNDVDAALLQYEKAIKQFPDHARSRLRVAEIYAHRGKLKEAAPQLEFLIKRPNLLAPKDLALAFYLHSQFSSMNKNWNLALGDVEKAVRFDPGNRDYLLEMYTLRSKLGDASPEFQKEAKMYYFLGEGERRLKERKTHEALTSFLKARQVDLNSPLPLERIGEMFTQLGDLYNARLNLSMAIERAPGNLDVATKYLEVLVRSYEWDEAGRQLSKYRSSKMNPSVLDKLQGDLLAYQGRHQDAAAYYKRAMSRETVDSKVYNSYGQMLFKTGNCKDAPFFYSLALRFDPFNTDAILGIARCIAQTDSVDRAVGVLQDQLQKIGGTKAELLAAIAEFQAQKGELVAAQQFVEQASRMNPDLAQPWLVQAKIHLAQQRTDRQAIEKAIDAYQSYIDRNPSDATGYLERHRLFIMKNNFGAAEAELNRVAAMYPHFPNVHVYKGRLYAMLGKHKQALEEFEIEIKDNSYAEHAYIGAAKSLIELNQPADALKRLNSAMGINPRNVESKVQAALANFILKNYAAAAALYEAAAQLDPGNPDIWKRMGLAYREAGNTMQARKAFRKYAEMEPDAPDRKELQNY